MIDAATDKPSASPTKWRLEGHALRIRRGGRLILDSIDLAIGPGECVSVIGPNGSGKTTLLMALLGFLPLAGGTVRLNGQDWRRLSARTRGRFAAYVPQGVELVPAFSVHDVVAGGRFPYTPRLHALTSDDRAAVGRALELCGLTPLAQRSFNAISGGERQKTLIAAAIAQDPQLMFLDEPTTALDPAHQLELARILRQWQQTGRSLVVVSHDLQLPAALGGRVLALRDGHVVASGPASDILTPERLSDVYGAPFGTLTTLDGKEIALPRWW